MLPVIHFLDFESFLEEVRGMTIIRCKILQTSVPGAGRFLRDVTVSLRLGAIQDGCILSYLAYQKVIEGVDIPPRGRLDEAWSQAEKVEEAIKIVVGGCDGRVRPGVIDLGGVVPIPGRFVDPVILLKSYPAVDVDPSPDNRLKVTLDSVVG